MTIATDAAWLVLVTRLPAEPSRHRVGVWRELRRLGALSLGQGTWAVPDVPVFAAGVARVVELAEHGGGEVLTVRGRGDREADGDRLLHMFVAARSADWDEFLSDCDKFDAELLREIAIEKFTLAELEEEEQSLERLRRWHRDLTARDVFGVPEGLVATERLQQCVMACEGYAGRVFQVLHGREDSP